MLPPLSHLYPGNVRRVFGGQTQTLVCRGHPWKKTGSWGGEELIPSEESVSGWEEVKTGM